MLDRLYLPLLGLAAIAAIALSLVWPQGLGARSPGPFGHTPVQQTPEMKAAMARENAAAGVTVVGDLGGDDSLQAWFDARPVGAVILRPDHVIAAECLTQELDDVLARVFRAASIA